MSDELKQLIAHQAQIKSWLSEVNTRIAEMEESYLEETPMGNIVRGWEIDGKLLPLRSRGGGPGEEKEKIFSNSSYQCWLETKAQAESGEWGRAGTGIKSAVDMTKLIRNHKKSKKNSLGVPRRDSSQYLDMEWDPNDD